MFLRSSKRKFTLLAVVLITAVGFLFLNESFLLSWSNIVELDSKTVAKDSRVVVSMSSFPGRMNHLSDCISSLESQTLVPDTIYVFVPRKVLRLSDPNTPLDPNEVHEHNELEPDILALNESSSRVQILWVEHDYGPSTKLLGSLPIETNSSTIIITVDDDMVYHPRTVEALVQAMTDHPNTAPCFVCEIIPWFTRVWTGQPMRQWWQGICHGWANAFASTAFRRGYFDDGIFDYDRNGTVPVGCKLHDDVWISGYLFRKGIRPYNLRPGFDASVRHFRHPTLSINAVINGESHYRDPCVKYFDNFGL